MNTDSKPTTSTETRPPLPPFTRESAIEKVRLAEDDWNSRDPSKVADLPISEIGSQILLAARPPNPMII